MNLSLKLCIVLAVITGLCLTGSTMAVPTFENSLNDQDMGNPDNWTEGGPVAGTNAQIDYVKYTGEIEPGILGTGGVIECQKFRIGWTDNDTVMIVDGGTVHSGQGGAVRNFWLAENDPEDTGSLEMYSGSIQHDQGHMWLGGEGHGTWLMEGGTVTATDGHFAQAFQDTGLGEMTMTGGTINTGVDLKVGRKGEGDWDMTGGTINVGNQLIIAEEETATGDMDLHGGIVEALNGDVGFMNLVIGPGANGDLSDGYLDIAYDGKLVLGGDDSRGVQAMIADGLITSLGTDQVSVSINGNGDTEVTGIPEPATVAMLGLGGLVLLRRKRS